jgi:hypothetical protein
MEEVVFDPIRNKQINGFHGLIKINDHNIFTIVDFSVTFKDVISFPPIIIGVFLIFDSLWSNIGSDDSIIRLDTTDKRTFKCANKAL